MPLELCGLSVLAIAKILSVAFLSIVFLQSGIDKVNNWSGNLSWMRDDHFAKTPLKKIVPILLGVLTLLEITSGVLGGVGIVIFLTGGSGMFMLWGAVFSAISLICLFFGQRMAQDYPGAASLVPYFMLSIIAIVLFGIPM
jgi:hypothetical protein